jgi:hypothetical protein
MDIGRSDFEVYGQNNARLGWMDSEGIIRSNETVIFRVVNGSIYSMHGGYLGRLLDGVGKTDRGQLIFRLHHA